MGTLFDQMHRAAILGTVVTVVLDAYATGA